MKTLLILLSLGLLLFPLIVIVLIWFKDYRYIIDYYGLGVNAFSLTVSTVTLIRFWNTTLKSLRLFSLNILVILFNLGFTVYSVDKLYGIF